MELISFIHHSRLRNFIRSNGKVNSHLHRIQETSKGQVGYMINSRFHAFIIKSLFHNKYPLCYLSPKAMSINNLTFNV